MFRNSILLPKIELFYEYKVLMIDNFDKNYYKHNGLDYYILVETEWLNFIIAFNSNKISDYVKCICADILVNGTRTYGSMYRIKFDNLKEESKQSLKDYLSFNSMYAEKLPEIKELSFIDFKGWQRMYGLELLKNETDRYIEQRKTSLLYDKVHNI